MSFHQFNHLGIQQVKFRWSYPGQHNILAYAGAWGRLLKKTSPFRNYSVNSTSKVWGNYFLGILLGNACQAHLQKCLFTEAPGGEPAILAHVKQGCNQWRHIQASTAQPSPHQTEPSEWGCGLWLICLCHRIPPKSVGQGKITRKSPQGWFSSFSRADGERLTRSWEVLKFLNEPPRFIVVELL